MGDRAKKKERKRLKRQQKQKSLRKVANASPFKRVATASELVAAYINSDWRERGQAVVYVLRRAGGTMAMAGFLVDLWCCGLKDAYGYFDILREEFDEQVERIPERMDGSITRVDIAEAAAVVAGGVRFARQNGFRLPRHYDRWLSFFGPDLAGRCKDADLSAFGVDGGRKIRYVGPMHDLRSRLVVSDADTFLSRPDAEFVTDAGLDPFSEYDDDDHDDDDDDDDDDDENDDEDDDPDLLEEAGLSEEDADFYTNVIDRVSNQLLDSVRRWCIARQIAAHPRLDEAVPRWMAVSLVAMTAGPEGADILEGSGHGGSRGDAIQKKLLAEALAQVDPDERAEMEPAFRQVIDFTRSADDPDIFLKAVGLESDNADEVLGDG
jgi:hypothetical protein